MVERFPNTESGVNNRREGRRAQTARVVGLVLVLAVIALPVVFSRQFGNPGTIVIDSPFSATTALEVLPGEHASVHLLGLWNDGNQNRVSHWQTGPITTTIPFTDTVEMDYLTPPAFGDETPLAALNGWCCFSRDGYFLPDGQLFTAGTSPGGILQTVIVDPMAGAVTSSRVDPTSSYDYTGLIALLNDRFYVGTSSTDSNETRFYSALISDTTQFQHEFSVPGIDVLDGYHPGIAEDSSGDAFYFAYVDSNWTASVMRYSNDIDWVIPIVDVTTTPDEFYYLWVDFDHGNLAVRVPSDDASYLWFATDADSTVPPWQTVILTDTMPIVGDYQGFWVDGGRVTEVFPDPANGGTEIQCTDFYTSALSVPPNTWASRIISDTTWNTGLTGHIHSSALPDMPGPGHLLQVNERGAFVVSGDQNGDLIRYGVADTPLHYDGSESGTTLFWDITRD